MSNKILLEEMSWMEARDAAAHKPVVVIPTGSVEQHGPHLPLLVDALLAMEIARASASEASNRVSVVVAPVLALGCSEEHLDFCGTLSLSPSTFMSVARESVLTLAHHGFDRFLFLNAHAGNMDALRLVVRLLRQEKNVLAAAASYWQLAAEEMRAVRQTQAGGIGHGGEEETSLMLHLRPDLVNMSAASPNPLRWRTTYLSGDYLREPAVAYGRMRTDIAPEGHNGDPTLASAERGARLLQVITEKVALFLVEFKTWDLEQMSVVGQRRT